LDDGSILLERLLILRTACVRLQAAAAHRLAKTARRRRWLPHHAAPDAVGAREIAIELSKGRCMLLHQAREQWRGLHIFK
jgi:hypothetical protein